MYTSHYYVCVVVLVCCTQLGSADPDSITCDPERNQPHPCGSYSCHNGVCRNVTAISPFGDSGPRCVCDWGWTGSGCDRCCTLPCQNGICLITAGKARCRCHSGWSGTLCAKAETNTASPSPCQSSLREPVTCGKHVCANGVCKNQTIPTTWGSFQQPFCECDPGWTGVTCDQCCHLSCVHGDCMDFPTGMRCMCHPGWTGALCDVTPSTTGPQENQTLAVTSTKTGGYVAASSCPQNLTGRSRRHVSAHVTCLSTSGQPHGEMVGLLTALVLMMK